MNVMQMKEENQKEGKVYVWCASHSNNTTLPLAEFFERWSDHAPLAYYTLSANPDISKISPDNTVWLDDGLRKTNGLSVNVHE